jgi:gas vesicle structural protein
MITSGSVVDRPRCSSLADVIDLILDKGMVIDAFIRVSVVGIELLTIDIRIVIASVDTYLRFAEAVNRLDLSENKPRTLPEVIGDLNEGGAKSKTKGMLDATGDKVRSFLGGDNENDDNQDDSEDDDNQDENGNGEEEATSSTRRTTRQRRSRKRDED